MIYKKFNDFIRRKNFGLLIFGLSMILILIISLISFMSYKTANAQSNSTNNKNFSNIKQIDEYFYEITYSDYEFDEELETRESDAKMHNNCLGIRNGNFYGRNFDHAYDTSPAFLVKMKKSNDRFASIGLCYYYTLTKEYLENNDCDHELDILPNHTLDGINEFGVVCQFNSVKLGDTETLVGTNPSAQDLYIGFAVRKILDHATSADHAISILANSNLVGQLDDKNTAQFMISDKEKTYIVDLLDNKLITNQVFGKDAIMTNFHKNIGYISNWASGLERFKIAEDLYNIGDTADGMRDILKACKYSGSFNNEAIINIQPEDPRSEDLKNNTWVSEELSQEQIKNVPIEDQLYTELIEKSHGFKEIYDQGIRGLDKSLTITRHSSVYDISNKSVTIYIDENYNNAYKYDCNWTLTNSLNDFLMENFIIIVCVILSLVALSFIFFKTRNNNRK